MQLTTQNRPIVATHRDVIAPAFYRYYNDVLRNGHREYWTQGGRGSMKSTTISVCIVAQVVRDAVLWADRKSVV